MDKRKQDATLLFLGLETFGRLGGIQRFNQRLIRSGLRVFGPTRFAALISRDLPAQVPADLADMVHATGPDRLGFIRQTLCASRHADVVILGHINLLPVGVLAKLLRPRLRLVLMVHGIEVWNDPVFRRRPVYEPLLTRFVTRIAAVSRYTAGVMAREYRLAGSRFMLFPNTVDADVAQAHSPDTPPYLLAVSRMDSHDRSKHLDQVIRAVALLPKALDRAQVQIVGDGVLRPELEALALAQGVAERVVFQGRVDDARLAALYAGATGFVLPSAKEGFGIVYLEAWSHLLPVICAAAGAAPEVVSDGVDGYVVDPLRVDDLADRMARLIAEPALAAQMGRAGAEKLVQCYSTAVLDRNFQRLMDEALS